MTDKIDIKFTLQNFGLDIHFDKVISNLLENWHTESIYILNYRYFKNTDKIIFHFVTRLPILQKTICPIIDEYLNAYNEFEKRELMNVENWKIEYKIQNAKVGERYSNWYSFERYINLK